MTTFDTVIIGGGQAGLALGHHLRRAGRRFVIVEAADRLGDSWRRRWDSLTLFTPRRYDALPGLRFPGDPEGRFYPRARNAYLAWGLSLYLLGFLLATQVARLHDAGVTT